MPGLLRAGSRLRPLGRSDLDRRAERLVRRQRPEGVVVVRAHRRPLHPRRPKRPGLAAPRGPHLHHRRHEGAWRRGAPAAPDHRRGRVQRDLPHGRRGAEGEPSRRDRRRLAGGDDDAPPRARHARLRARRRARASGAEARRAHEGEGRRRPDHPRPRRPGVDRAPGAEDDELPLADDADEDRDPRPRGLGLEAALVGAEPAADQARHGDPRGRGRRLLAPPAAAEPRQHDRGRDLRDPAKHHRRARARPPEEPR